VADEAAGGIAVRAVVRSREGQAGKLTGVALDVGTEIRNNEHVVGASGRASGKTNPATSPLLFSQDALILPPPARLLLPSSSDNPAVSRPLTGNHCRHSQSGRGARHTRRRRTRRHPGNIARVCIAPESLLRRVQYLSLHR
jgi:hypothetical protein